MRNLDSMSMTKHQQSMNNICANFYQTETFFNSEIVTGFKKKSYQNNQMKYFGTKAARFTDFTEYAQLNH